MVQSHDCLIAVQQKSGSGLSLCLGRLLVIGLKLKTVFKNTVTCV